MYLWQKSYVDRVIRATDDVRAVAAYVLANPVRAGLASRIGEYAGAGSMRYSVAELLMGVEDARTLR